MIRHKKVFQRLQAKCGALKHGSKTRRVRKPVQKTRFQIPQTHGINADVQEHNINERGALGPFMLTSSSFGETPMPVCSCGVGALLKAQAL